MHGKIKLKLDNDNYRNEKYVAQMSENGRMINTWQNNKQT